MPRKPSCMCGDCRKCKRRAYMKQWYERKTLEERRAWWHRRDPDKVRAADRARYYRDQTKRLALNARWHQENPERSREIARAWDKRNPEKKRAHLAVRRAVLAGRLERGECAELIHAHHEDYTRPLDVTWLCSKHHGMRHRLKEVA